MKLHKLLFAGCVFLLSSEVSSSPQIIDNEAIRSRNISPTLGRGYSTSTGNIASACLIVDLENDVTEASFDYDYEWFETTSKESITATTETVKKKSKAVFLWIRSTIESSYSATTTQTDTTEQHITALLSVDKYYISADETSAELLPDALSLIEQSLYVSFFQACGPNYIRSIRRTSSIVSDFKYKVTVSSSSEFNLKVTRAFFGFGSSSSALSESSMEITIAGFGIALQDTKPLRPRTVEQYKEAIDHGFESLKDVAVGNVESIEVVPWMANIQFQNAAELDTLVQTGDSGTLSPFLRRFYLLVNSEHIARLDENVRSRLRMMNMQIACLGALSRFLPDHNNHLLQDLQTRCPAFENCGPSQMTIGNLKNALIGEQSSQANRYLMQRNSASMSLFIKNYFGPCLQEMARDQYGIEGGRLQSMHWTSMPSCQDVSCSFPGVNWNDSLRTCEASVGDNVDLVVDKYCMPTLTDYKLDSSGDRVAV
mmetsp:Transcript_28640/g.65459  ORF Transcript_28640/g.65459 Transcript_28640/m.65459 type:complete len:484 (-) Transcript_28640:110-1561(-)|eukprot:CAMPEP_0113304178 /NCGR_PEP_ID=MMETSP0010_2-20120614/4299_1 /TAXON_ID=216773 ORGANISM="Corethron hystrix, Strain 308" /NCGR_SAMPLE_ID=MMETSP0010_2 /ASSEMBLY_ACC=CAM_ASM_000155 /LENGTH=483 /DNA_ID=CAMNT_0000158325 /DNA_START=101 /DNA_END=1552 /DNA_ORIENTATION=- /assembly_acc=CAM_ASM_000155